MTYTGLELFMEKLKQLIYLTDKPFIKNKRSFLSNRSLFRVLHEELRSMIQILFPENENDLHGLEQVRNLKKIFKDVAEEAHDMVDQLLSVINFKNRRLLLMFNTIDICKDLEDVMITIKTIKEEFTSILENTEMDSSPRINHPKTKSAAAGGASFTRNALCSKKVSDEIVVGLDRDAELIRDKLVEDQKQLDVVSIVGMGGLGKTTLATKIFNDPFVVYHFHVRAWVTVSQTYEKYDLLVQILASIGFKLDILEENYSRLREMLHKSLMGNRYLIVIDDMWNTKAWDDLKVFFPHNQTGSRILLTSRLKEVALHARPDGFIHQLECLTREESWELLQKKVFLGNGCPNSLIKPGKKIAKTCRGLPIALVAIAGVLAKETISSYSWERIARNVTSYVLSHPNRYMETLALSVDHLPSHLRDCFLYLGGFPEDYTFRVRSLIWLWVAEGFIQEAGNQSMEDTAEDYLMELVDRNLVLVKGRKSNGAIKTFSIHDVLRELCLEIATKERFFLKIPERAQDFNPVQVASYKKRRIFAYRDIVIINASNIRSFLSFYNYSNASCCIVKFSHSWMLLIVLDLQHTKVDYISDVISLLIHLRYLAIWYDKDFPSSITNLWSLQTLIIRRKAQQDHLLPETISKLVNLRHLRCNTRLLFPRNMKTMNLLTISDVTLGDWPKRVLECVPSIKKISLSGLRDMKYDFKSLTSLEALKISGYMKSENIYSISFPASLKKLTLGECHLPWSCMSKIQSLPKLEVLKLLDYAFVGPRWDAGKEPFQQLKFLKLCWLNIKQWEASSINFPCLKQLVLENCNYLEEIPAEIGYIPTLEYIKIETWNDSTVDSVDRIQEEQHADGNFDLKIIVKRSWHDHSQSLSPWLYKYFSGLSIYREGLSIDLQVTNNQETLGVPTNPQPFIPTPQYMHRHGIWNERTSKRRPIKLKI